MKNRLAFIFLFVLSLVTVACHKTDSVIPQEPFVGTYSVAGKQAIIGANGKIATTIDITDRVTVSLTPTSNRIKISSVSNPDLEAVLINKSSFKIDDQLFPDQTTSNYSKKYSGTGAVVNNQLLLSIDVIRYANQVSNATRTLTHVEGDRQ